MIGKDLFVKHKSSQLKGFGSKTCASAVNYIGALTIEVAAFFALTI
jgi:hypothetical protein